MRSPSARERVVELLRTLDDAREDRSINGDGGGVIQMPVLYNQGSYQELEARLSDMRDTHRREWWNVSARYRWGALRREPVPTVKTRQGRKPVLPPRSELRIASETLGTSPGGPVFMVVQYYQWMARVEPEYIERGIDLLLEEMHGGDSSKIRLPKPFLDRLMEDRRVTEPEQSNLPRHPLTAA